MRVLEDDDGDEEDEPNPLDSSQTLSLNSSAVKQIGTDSQQQFNNALTQNEMNELNVFIRDIVSQAGFSPALALNDEQFEHVYSFVTRDLSKTEQDV